jgi:probable phosphoglycerate mutase
MARAERAPRASGLRTDRRAGGRRKPPAPTLILFVRHGATATTGKELPGRASGLHLSDAGRAQAESVAARVAAMASGNGRERRTVAAVYSSPLERTRETAAPIADATGCQVQVDDGLLELDIGDWTGLELKAARKRPEWAAIQRYPSGFTFPGGRPASSPASRGFGPPTPARRSWPSPMPTPSAPPSPTRWGPTSTCSSAS